MHMPAIMMINPISLPIVNDSPKKSVPIRKTKAGDKLMNG